MMGSVSKLTTNIIVRLWWLLLFGIALNKNNVVTVQGIKISADTWKSLVVNPNPVPSMEELESTTTTEEIDAILDRFFADKGGGMIIPGYRPEAGWLWKQWFGTVLVHSVPTALFNMAMALLFCLGMRFWTHGDLEIFGSLPAASSSPILERLLVVDKIWKTLMGLTTFILTFFVGQAYTFWRGVHDLGRGIQGRFNDINMLLATHATTVSSSSSSSSSTRYRRGGNKMNNRLKDSYQYHPQQYTPEAMEVLTNVQHKLRVSHLLYWASNAVRFRVILTNKGFDRMVERSIISKEELEWLQNLDLPNTQRFVAYMESAMMTCSLALEDAKVIRPHSVDALAYILLEQFCQLRGTYGKVGGMVDGRMPLAYAHFVQILVDSFLFLAPIAQYDELGIFSVFSIGILTLFYHGMLNLAKAFFDPLDNEDYCEGCVFLNLSVLIREGNNGSTRWMRAVAPASSFD